MPSTPETIAKFVQFCQQHLRGDEKGEAQVFLDRFFRAFGHEGAIEDQRTHLNRKLRFRLKGFILKAFRRPCCKAFILQ